MKRRLDCLGFLLERMKNQQSIICGTETCWRKKMLCDSQRSAVEKERVGRRNSIKSRHYLCVSQPIYLLTSPPVDDDDVTITWSLHRASVCVSLRMDALLSTYLTWLTFYTFTLTICAIVKLPVVREWWPPAALSHFQQQNG